MQLPAGRKQLPLLPTLPLLLRVARGDERVFDRVEVDPPPRSAVQTRRVRRDRGLRVRRVRVCGRTHGREAANIGLHVADVEDRTPTELQAFPPIEIRIPLIKPEPVNVTIFPPEVGPPFGVKEVIWGGFFFSSLGG